MEAPKRVPMLIWMPGEALPWVASADGPNPEPNDCVACESREAAHEVLDLLHQGLSLDEVAKVQGWKEVTPCVCVGHDICDVCWEAIQ